MYRMLTLPELIRAFGLLSALVFILLILVAKPEMDWSLIRYIGLSTTIVILIVLALGNGPVFRFFWRFGWVQDIFFPYIHGDWRGTIASNWAIIEQLREYAQNPKKGANLSHFTLDHTPATQKDVVVKIDASFFKLEAQMSSKDDYMESVTIIIKPQRRREGEKAKLYYFFDARVPMPKATDSAHHFGAAALNVTLLKEGKVLMEGHYWTDRDWHKGINTAGRIRLER